MAQVAALKARKRSIPPAAYQRDLERILIELARVSRKLRHAVQDL